MRPSDDANAQRNAELAPATLPASAGGEWLRRSLRLSPWQLITLTLLGGVIAFGACRGDNLFTGNSEAALPAVDGIVASGPVYGGDTLGVQVSAHATRQVTSIELSLAGAATADTTFTLASPNATVSQSYRLPLPSVLRDTILVISARAYDKTGAVSPEYADTIAASSVPVVLSLQGPDSIRGDGTLHFTFSAGGRFDITSVRFSFQTGLTVPDTVLTIAQPDTLVSGAFDVPITVISFTDTILTLQVTATDAQGAVSAPYISRTPVVISQPTIAILTPADSQTVSLTDPLLVRVHAQAPFVGIKSIALSGVAIRSSSTSNAVVVTRYKPQSITFPQPPSLQMPVDTTLARYLVPLSDTTSEHVSIIATITDSLGNVGVDTAYVSMGGPLLRLDNPASGLRVGPSATIPVAVHVQDAGNGIDTVVVTVTGGATPSAIYWTFNSITNPLDVDTVVTAPTTPGQLVFKARTRNHIGLQAWAADTVTVLSTAVPDSLPPVVRIVGIDSGNAALTHRLEEDDSIGVIVAIADSGTAGIKRIGLTVQADTGGISGPIASTQLAIDVAPPLTIPPQHTFYFRPSMLPQLSADSIHLPKVVNFRVTAFALDTMNNCGAGVTVGQYDGWQCGTFNSPGGTAVDTVAVGAAGYLTQLTLVAGRTIMLQPQSRVADLAPDTVRGRLYIANMGLNEVEQLQVSNNALLTPIRAGSQPWGLDLYRDTMLIVANSGGTNISRVSLSGTTPVETSRLLTPNITLWQYTRSRDQSTGSYKWTITGPMDFSDRPQFLAQDSKDRVLYSTVPTASASLGTLRAAEKEPTWKNTETWLLNRRYGWDPDTSTFAVENVDSVGLYADGTMSAIVHVPGDSANAITVGPEDPAILCAQNPATPNSLAAMRAAGQTIAYCAPGKWNLSKIGLSDTTFIAIARDRSHIAFGEGGVSTGRIFMWNSTTDAISPDIDVGDLVGNASERVVGLGLNMNGTLGVARGQLAGYFFDPNLRLQGEFGDVINGTGGAAVDPHHVDAYASNDSTLAFLGSEDAGRPVIKIVDTFSFRQRGEIFIHDNVVGLLKASMPMPGDPSCATNPGPNCVVLKLYGVTPSVTDANGQTHARVVVIDVRRSDILP